MNATEMQAAELAALPEEGKGFDHVCVDSFAYMHILNCPLVDTLDDFETPQQLQTGQVAPLMGANSHLRFQ